MASVLATHRNAEKPKPTLFSAAAFVLLAFALIGAALLIAGPRDYPVLHIILSIGICLLSAVLAFMHWETGKRLKRLNQYQEASVREQTAQLVAANEALQTEIHAHRLAQKNAQAQLERLNLLHEITRTIGERHDIASIFPAVLRSLEERLPVELCCICLYNGPDKGLTVSKVGSKCTGLAANLALSEHATVPIDDPSLAQCVRGHQIHEGNLEHAAYPFAQRLFGGGLRSLVISPLQTEGRTIGVLVTARQRADAFSAEECKFLRRLGEHVARASNKAQLYGALQQAYDDLRQSQRATTQQERLSALGQMAGAIGHEVSNALSSMSLIAETLLETDSHLNPQARESVKTLQLAVDNLGRTVTRVRDFCRRREPDATLAPLQLNQLVQQALDLTRLRLSKTDPKRGLAATVKVELGRDLPPIAGVESEVQEALVNLVLNAFDAMPGGGTLSLRTKTIQRAEGGGAGFVQLDVVDTGIGMDEEARRRCMEPFFTTKGELGSGLGLAAVYGMVRRHGGEIEIRSARGRGTTVSLVFPGSVATVAPSATMPRLLAAPPRLRLLLVDDDPLLLKSLGDLLEADGHLVTAIGDGRVAIDAFREANQRRETFSAVITDLGMPYVDGRKVATSVKEIAPSVPVILLTGWSNLLTADEQTHPHIDRVLTKPLKARELRQTLAEMCKPAAIG